MGFLFYKREFRAAIYRNDDNKTVYSAGTDGFVLRISGNPLAQDNLQSLVNTLGTKFNGFSFRAYSVSSPANPAIEAGDIVNMTDKNGVTHKTLVSHISYEYGESERYSADAETLSENQSERFTAAEKVQETADNAQGTANSAEETAESAEKEVELVKASVGGIEVRVTATEEGLESKVSKDEISSEIQQHPTDVVFAFNNLSGTQSLKFDGTGFDVYDGSTKIAHIGVLKSEESGTTTKTYTAIQSVNDSAGIALRPNNGKGLYLLNTDSNGSGYDLMHMGYAFFEKGVASHGLISTNGNMNCDTLTCKTLTAESGGGGDYVTAGQMSGTTLGEKATAEGEYTTASGDYSHVEGRNAIASSYCSHAEGDTTIASYDASHAEGWGAIASGRDSHAEGAETTAHDYAEHAGGAYNKVSTGNLNAYDATNNAFVIGNGARNSPSNCFRVDFSGNVYGLAAFNSSGADYAEYFEWVDENPKKEDRVGHFVALKGSKIRFAMPDDDILGIVSACPSVVGDAASESWNGRYARDIFGRVILETVNVPAEYSKDGKVTHEAHTELRQKANSDYDASKEADYISREKRPEWSAIGMNGKLVMLDDGTCKADGYCKPADGGTGIATATKERNNCRVMERLDKTHIRVCLK